MLLKVLSLQLARKESAKMGLFSTTVDNELVPYIFPQEYGNHCDVRWVCLHDDKATSGVFILAGLNHPVNFSARWFKDQEIAAAQHTHELHFSAPRGQQTRAITLNVDNSMMGVGGDDSWSGLTVLEKYWVKPPSCDDLPWSWRLLLAALPLQLGQRNLTTTLPREEEEEEDALCTPPLELAAALHPSPSLMLAFAEAARTLLGD